VKDYLSDLLWNRIISCCSGVGGGRPRESSAKKRPKLGLEMNVPMIRDPKLILKVPTLQFRRPELLLLKLRGEKKTVSMKRTKVCPRVISLHLSRF